MEGLKNYIIYTLILTLIGMIFAFKHLNSNSILKETQYNSNIITFKDSITNIKIQTQLLLDSIVAEAIKDSLSMPYGMPIEICKLNKPISEMSPYGFRVHPISGIHKLHAGIDLVAPKGTEIKAVSNGIVITKLELENAYGNHIIIDHGNNHTTLYAHLDTIYVNRGDVLHKNQVIGTLGSTGHSVAPHLHYEVRINNVAIDPIKYLMR